MVFLTIITLISFKKVQASSFTTPFICPSSLDFSLFCIGLWFETKRVLMSYFFAFTEFLTYVVLCASDCKQKLFLKTEFPRAFFLKPRSVSS